MASKKASIKTAEVPGPKSQELLKLKEKYISKAVSIGQPVFIEKAEGSLLLTSMATRSSTWAVGLA